MESHSCEKNRGEGLGGPLSVPKALPAGSDMDDDRDRCCHIDAQGRRCRMLLAGPSAEALTDETALVAGLCSHHAQRLLRSRRAAKMTAADLLASVGEFTDPVSVNRFLANLARMVALKRIPRRDGAVLAYIAQLILNSQAAQDRKQLVAYELERLYDLKHPPR